MVEFTVANQAHVHAGRQQAIDIRQQFDLLNRRAVTLARPYPRPGQRQTPAAERDTHHQPPMPTAHFRRIDDEPYLPTSSRLAQQRFRAWRIPLPHTHRAIPHKARQPLHHAQFFGSNRQFACYQVQLHTPGLEYPEHQPHQIRHAPIALIGNPLQRKLIQATIQGGNGQVWHLKRSSWFCLSNSTLLAFWFVFNSIPRALLFSVA